MLRADPPVSAPLKAPRTRVVDVSVVIVTYNVRGFLEQALESVAQASGGLTVETFVVDNDSADGSAAMVRERFPAVRLIANEDNVGFATANNQAIGEAAGRYLLILNPDTLVQEDTLRELVAFMDAHPEAGAAGCRILNPDGTFAPESRRAFPTPAVAFYRIAGLSRLFPRSPRFGRYNLTHLPTDEVCEVDALSGSCMMVRRAALVAGRDGAGDGAGLLDENFFMYGEDLDWCFRIQQAGWRIYYTPQTQIVHYKGESTKAGDLRYVVLFYGAMLRFVEKHVRSRADARGVDRVGSALLSAGLRAGIVARAALAAARRLGRAAAAPARDLALTWAAFVGAALAWSSADGFAFSTDFFALVAPAYAGTLVAALALAGSYRAGSGRRLRPVLHATVGAVAAVATASFFAPDIAFSRGAIVLGFAAAALALLAERLWRRSQARGPRRALVVGSADEAVRLQRLVAQRGGAPIEVVGYVAERPDPAQELRHVGLPRQLRALARLQRADDVIFAADSLSNTAILNGMRALRDVPVHLKILASGRDRIIGKASVEDLSAPLLDAERTVAPLRPAAARRAVEVPVALALLALRPALRGLGRPRLAEAAAAARDVLAGRRALIGYHPADPHPPEAWGLAPAVVSVLDTLPARPDTIVEAHRAYWFYARHQSARLDLAILFHALRAR
jgi:GT2 family glycosyltransferase